MSATITCTRCQRQTSPMSEAPLPNPEGAELLAHCCEDCFHAWLNTETMIINEYKLDLGQLRNQELLNQEMARFLSLPSAGGEAPSGAPPQATPVEKKPHAHGKDHGGSCC